MKIPKRIAAESGRYSLVDGIPFRLPVEPHHSPALMAAFTIDAAKAATLYARVLNGHVPVEDGGENATEGLVGSGILRIPPPDFAMQLTTFRVHGPTLAGRVEALHSFGQLFLSELWQVFGPVRRLALRAGRKGVPA